MSENTDAAVAATLVDMSPPSMPGEAPEPTPPLSATEQDAVRELVRQARASGTSLTGPDGLLKQLTKMVVEAALDEEMSDHLGYDKGDQAGRNRANSRNGKRTKTVITDNAGPVDIGCRETEMARSSRSSCPSGPGACRTWMRWCCRCRPRA